MTKDLLKCYCGILIRPNVIDVKSYLGRKMKKIGLICVAVLLCGGLSACGNKSSSKSSKLASLRAEHSSLIAESKKKAKSSSTKKHKHNSESNSTAASKASSKKQNKQNRTQSSNHATAQGSSTSSASYNSNNGGNRVSGSDTYNGDPNRHWDGTRKASTFQ